MGVEIRQVCHQITLITLITDSSTTSVRLILAAPYNRLTNYMTNATHDVAVGTYADPTYLPVLPPVFTGGMARTGGSARDSVEPTSLTDLSHVRNPSWWTQTSKRGAERYNTAVLNGEL